MTSLKNILMTSAVAAVALAPAGNALAAGGSTQLQSPSDVKIEGAYAYFTSYKPLNRPLVQVVVKTKGEMPRRFDGLIRAGGTIVGSGGGGSTGSVGKKGSHCYTFTVGLKDGRFYPKNGKGTGAKASLGSKHEVSFGAKDADGVEHDSTKAITLTKKRAGDDSGKRLHC